MDTIPRLDSWLLWRGWGPRLYKKYNYRWPDSYEHWEAAVGNSCPICEGAKTFVESVSQQRVYCICEMLQWADNHDRYWGIYETPVKPASLDILKPFSFNGNSTGAKDLKEFLGYLTKWIEHPDRWFIVQGGVGSGKTSAFRAIKTMLPAITVYISMDRFQRHLFASRADNTVEHLIHTLAIAPILILDDWGLEHDSNWTTNSLASIVNTRYMNGPTSYITLMSTNLQVGELLNSPSLPLQRGIRRSPRRTHRRAGHPQMLL